jgi:gentisate 1,2-dioxygenase
MAAARWAGREAALIGEAVDRAAAAEEFYGDLENDYLQGLWRVQTMSPEPRPVARPHLWRWETLERQLGRAGELMTMDRGAERRVLLLVNPGLQATYATTHTLTACVQMIKPGEVAPAHRHSPTAIRFIIQGQGAYTTVEGERIAMRPGDLILTPSGTWHDHGNETDAPIIWMDGLDRPIITAFNASFFEPYPEDRQPVLWTDEDSARRYGAGVRPLGQGARGRYSPQRVYRWEETYATLRYLAAQGEAHPYDDVALEYVNPTTGGRALPTLGLSIQLLRPGVRTRAHRHTSSAVYHVFRGRGCTVIEGQRFEWAGGDFLALPPWSWHEHANTSVTDEAILFSITDLPAVEALGLYREEPYPDGQQPAL